MKKKRNNKAALKKSAFKKAHLGVVLVQQEDHVAIGARAGLLGGHVGPVFRLSHEDIAGAVENREELGNALLKIGLLCLSQAIHHNLAFGTDGLAESLATWAGLDVEAIKRDAEQDTGDGLRGALEAVTDSEGQDKSLGEMWSEGLEERATPPHSAADVAPLDDLDYAYGRALDDGMADSTETF